MLLTTPRNPAGVWFSIFENINAAVGAGPNGAPRGGIGAAGTKQENPPLTYGKLGGVRWSGIAAAAVVAAGMLSAPPAVAEPINSCDDPYCVPGIQPNVVLGSYCSNTTYFVYGTTSWGRLVFCGSPRRYEPRWFRSPQMRGIKVEGTNCTNFDNQVAQAPDGLFLACVARNGASRWERGDL
jgi:hypothetical protein